MRELHEPDFIERNGGWILSMVGMFGTCLTGCFVYLLKSRCRTIQCLGVRIERDVVHLESGTLQVTNSKPVVHEPDCVD